MNAALSDATEQYLKTMGARIAKSTCAGSITVQTGELIAHTLLVRQVDILWFTNRYDVMNDKFRMKSLAMLSEFRQRGGKYKALKRDKDGAEIEVKFEGHTQNFSLTWEDVQDEDFITDKRGDVKSNYATGRKRATMLWYRLISDCLSVICPEILVDPITNALTSPLEQSLPIAVPTLPGQVKPVEETPTPKPETKLAEVVSTPDDPAGAEKMSIHDKATPEQRDRIKAILVELKDGDPTLTKRVIAHLKRHNIEGGLLGLTFAEARSLEKSLQGKQVVKWFDETCAAWEQQPGE